MTKRDWAWLYPLYSRLMRWSSDLDTLNKVWGPPLPDPEDKCPRRALIEMNATEGVDCLLESPSYFEDNHAPRPQ